MEKITTPIVVPVPEEPLHTIICPLCGWPTDVRWHEAHMVIHAKAEMLADILALSRR